MACFAPDTLVCLDVAQTHPGLNPQNAYRVVACDEGPPCLVTVYDPEFETDRAGIPCEKLTDDPAVMSGKSSEK